MKRYEVTSHFVTLHTGRLDLSASQASDRMHALQKVQEGIYTVLSSIQFKRGEQFGYDGEVNKALLQHLEVAATGKKPVAAEKAKGQTA